MNVLQSLKSISSYPIPSATIEDIAEGEGLYVEADADFKMRKSSSFLMAKAKVYEWLVGAPMVSQGGASYSLSATERNHYKEMAQELRKEAGALEEGKEIIYGYQGEDL